jgi:hypothetical protein
LYWPAEKQRAELTRLLTERNQRERRSQQVAQSIREYLLNCGGRIDL